MSMMSSGPGAGAGRVAAGEAEAAAHETLVAEGAAVASTTKKRSRFVRILLWCVPKPKSSDGWTNTLAIAAVIFIPLWFILAHKWNPTYVPVRPWVWAVPWIISVYWLGAQMVFLSVSIQKSAEQIRWTEIVIAFLPPISCLVTFGVIDVLWWLNLYPLGGFQMHEFVAFFSVTAFYAFVGGGVRFALKGKIFGQLGAVNN